MIEEVGHDHEQRRVTALDAAPGDGSSEVRLAAAARSGEDEPSLRRVGESLGRLDGLGEPLLVPRVRAAAARAEVLERQARERTEVRVALESCEPRVVGLVLRALAGEGAAEVGMAKTHGTANEARATAERADVRLGRDQAVVRLSCFPEE